MNSIFKTDHGSFCLQSQALKRLKQGEFLYFKDSLGYRVRPCFGNPEKNKKIKRKIISV